MAVLSHKGCRLGWAIQTDLGTAASVATVVFPLPEGTDFGPKWTKELYQNNQGNYERTHYFTSAYIAEGGIKFPWVPGMLTAATGAAPAYGDMYAGTGNPLFQWLFGRDQTSWQGKYATLFMDWGGNYSVISDVKCTGGTIAPEKGSPVYLDVNARSGKQPVQGVSGNFPAYSTGVWFDGTPYHGDNIYVQKGTAGGALAIDNWTKGHSLEWDNQVIDAGDASLIVYQNGPGPYALPNVARTQWKGGFTRWFVDTYFPNTANAAGFEGSYKLTVTSGASIGELFLPRIVYVDGMYPKMPGDGIVQNEVTFEALGGLGVPGVPCFTFREA